MAPATDGLRRQCPVPRRNVSPEEGAKELQALASRAGLPVLTFFELLTFFFTVDASSYPFLEERVFVRDDSGYLRPRSPKYGELAAHCAA